MKILLSFLLGIFLYGNAFASLTIGYVPNTKQSSPPVLQNGSIFDTGTPSATGNVGLGSTNPGSALDVQGTLNGGIRIFGNVGVGTWLAPTVINVGISSSCPNGKINGVRSGIVTSCY